MYMWYMLQCQITKSPNYQTTKLPYYHTTKLPKYQITKLPKYMVKIRMSAKLLLVTPRRLKLESKRPKSSRSRQKATWQMANASVHSSQWTPWSLFCAIWVKTSTTWPRCSRTRFTACTVIWLMEQIFHMSETWFQYFTIIHHETTKFL